ncbi:MAG: hypothetical protein WB679_18375, partial [Terracidiphilus sp.]
YSQDDPKGAPVEGINPEGESILGGWAMGSIAGRAAGAVIGEIVSWFQPEGRVVIGKMADLQAEGTVRSGERALADDLADMGNPKANWAQNSSKLREVMSDGKPIRDVSAGNPGSNTGFLRAVRNECLRAVSTPHEGTGQQGNLHPRNDGAEQQSVYFRKRPFWHGFTWMHQNVQPR